MFFSQTDMINSLSKKQIEMVDNASKKKAAAPVPPLTVHKVPRSGFTPLVWSALVLLAFFITFSTAIPLEPTPAVAFRADAPAPTLPPNGHATRVGVRSLWTHGVDGLATPVPAGESVSTRCCLGVPQLYFSDDTADCEAWAYKNEQGIDTYKILDEKCESSVSSAAYHGFYPLTGCWQYEGYYTTILSMTPPGETLTAPPPKPTA